ncbi:epoxide hydrolase [Fusarium sporotrichioides]|uniref:Epoxide hydrolase n=1 Tax=Fusarium sporotrichioides TaxID=5514 RepID=A0A395SPP9_FUSSP|nr:epoxide hydrolase [Fusarium sporotrichioides]
MAQSNDKSIRPFKVAIAQSDLDDLQTRLQLTRWPDKELVDDWSQGVPLASIQDLCKYWQTEYDWRRCEALLNSYPQFTTTIDGVEIYFLHIQSKHQDATPLLLTHGWPGSVLEFRHVIDKLVDPESHGGSPENAFHLVMPALPGYGFSGKPKETGWGHGRTARAWAELMGRLGYQDRGWVAQGGDWGAFKEVQVPIKDTQAEERAMRLDSLRDIDFRGYSLEQSTKPQTVGYGLVDSPVGQAAWIYEKYQDWTHHDGDLEGLFSKDEMLDTIMLYWLTNSATSSARYYWESGSSTTALEIHVPVGVSWFGGDNSYAPKEWCERYYKNTVYWNETPKGGHFAAWEQPDVFVAEIREWNRQIRQGVHDGDSWTDTRFDISGQQPSSSNPIGNTGKTSSNGKMWPMYLTTQYNVSSILLYNLAVGGAVVDRDIVTTGPNDVDTQVHDKLQVYVNQKPNPFPPKETLWTVFIGINDIYRTINEDNQEETIVAIIARLRQLTIDLYSYGARQFLFISTPPQSLFPNNRPKDIAPKLEAASQSWNKKLKKLVHDLDHELKFSTFFFFDIVPLITAVTEDPSQFPETAVYKSNAFCADYKAGTSVPDFKSETCEYNALEYMYIDGAHPTQAFHQILAKKISEQLSAGNSIS